MANVHVLKSGDIAPLFTVLHGELPHTGARMFKNRKYRSVLMVPFYNEKKVRKFTNVIQLSNPSVERELALQYPDDIGSPAVSLIESAFSAQDGNMPFGLGDLHKGAPVLFWDAKDSKEITAMLKWMRENLSDPALAIRLKYSLRVSFTDENDFVLARLKFC